MTRNDHLSLDEFATAQRKKPADGNPPGSATLKSEPSGNEAAAEGTSRLDARKALRQVKRERVKGESSIVNVSLDRRTKRRLKFASFNAETSMQEIAETAIVKYLDDIGA